MKKIISLSALFLGIMFIFSSCSTYEEGPMLSLKSKKARVAGTYTIAEVYMNGTLQESTGDGDDDDMTFTFEKDGTGSMVWTWTFLGTTTTYTYQLEWMFNDDETELMVRSKNQDDTDWSSWDSSTIIKLTDTEIWMQEYQGDDLYEYHYVEK